MTEMNQPMQCLTSRKTVEWYTPPGKVELVREVLGGIGLDPASCGRAQEWIVARRWFGEAEDGLKQRWLADTVFLNPPFSNTSRWVDKMISEYALGHFGSGILLVNANFGYNWFNRLWESYPCCIGRLRIRFIREDGVEGGESKRAQAWFYFGDDWGRFKAVFAREGRIIYPDPPEAPGGPLETDSCEASALPPYQR